MTAFIYPLKHQLGESVTFPLFEQEWSATVSVIDVDMFNGEPSVNYHVNIAMPDGQEGGATLVYPLGNTTPAIMGFHLALARATETSLDPDHHAERPEKPEVSE